MCVCSDGGVGVCGVCGGQGIYPAVESMAATHLPVIASLHLLCSESLLAAAVSGSVVYSLL